MARAADWIRANLADAPQVLTEMMKQAVAACSDGSVPEALAGGAASLYQQVVGGDGARGSALPLLAADALLTHAFEAQAELDPSGLSTLATSWTEDLGRRV